MEAIKELKRIRIEYLRKKYPNFPSNSIPPKRYTDTTANGLTACISDFLRFKGHYVVRINTTGLYRADLKRFVKSSTTKGTADLHAAINGRHVSIEVKVGRDKQSEQQVEVQKKIEAAGGIYFIAKDFAGFMYWYNQFIKVV